MKVFNLQCALGHAFEGWFASAEDYDTQREKHMIACPICGDEAISRMPAAPRLNLSAAGADAAGESRADKIKAFQQHLVQVVRKLLAETEDVGKRFPEEARRIHYQEAPERPIRGQASHADLEALSAEGIDVIALPGLPPDKSKLQ